MVMEFMDGVDFEHLGDLERLLLSGEGTIVKEIGHIIAFDMFINNWDRLPIVWQNEGNLGNLFVQNVDKGKIVGIDQAVTCIHPVVNKVGYENYIERVRAFLDEITTSPDKESSQMKKFRELIVTSTGFDIIKTIEIQKGVMEMILRVSQLTGNDISAMKEELSNLIRVDWEKVWQNMVDVIHLDFLLSTLDLFKQYKDRIESII